MKPEKAPREEIVDAAPQRDHELADVLARPALAALREGKEHTDHRNDAETDGQP